MDRIDVRLEFRSFPDRLAFDDPPCVVTPHLYGGGQ